MGRFSSALREIYEWFEWDFQVTRVCFSFERIFEISRVCSNFWIALRKSDYKVVIDNHRRSRLFRFKINFRINKILSKENTSRFKNKFVSIIVSTISREKRYARKKNRRGKIIRSETFCSKSVSRETFACVSDTWQIASIYKEVHTAPVIDDRESNDLEVGAPRGRKIDAIRDESGRWNEVEVRCLGANRCERINRFRTWTRPSRFRFWSRIRWSRAASSNSDHAAATATRKKALMRMPNRGRTSQEPYHASYHESQLPRCVGMD